MNCTFLRQSALMHGLTRLAIRLQNINPDPAVYSNLQHNGRGDAGYFRFVTVLSMCTWIYGCIWTGRLRHHSFKLFIDLFF